MEDPPSGAEGVVANACKWVSLPGDACNMPVSTSMKFRAANQERNHALIRARPSKNGRRPVWTSLAHKGEAAGELVDIILVLAELRK